MKALRFLSLTLALVTGLTFTSCMSDDDDSTYSGVYYTICKLKQSMGYYYLVTSSGVIIYPTTSSMSTLESSADDGVVSSMVGHVVLFCYYAELDGTETTSIDDVTAYAIIDMQDELVEVEYEGADNDVEENAPIVSLYRDNITPYFFDSSTIILPVEYYLDSTVHNLTLVYYPDETEGSTITLHLRHDLGDDTDVNTGDNTTYYWANYSVLYTYTYYRAFDLSDVLDDVTPSIIKIAYKQSTGLDLDKATELEYNVTYTY